MFDVHDLNFGSAQRGLPLPGGLLQCMEALFGTSFADVRVHLGGEAESLGALAFAHGSDIYFEPGAWDPHTAEGWRLIGHELTHVRQSLRGWALAPEGVGVRLLVDPGLEAEAERMAELAVRAFSASALPAAPHDPAGGPRRWDVLQAFRRPSVR